MQHLRKYYYLSAVTLPFGHADIAGSKGWERRWKEEIRTQIDLGVSAEGAQEDPRQNLKEVAKQCLTESCGLRLSSILWEDQTQLGLRRRLGVDVPLSFSDGAATKVFILLLPWDAILESVVVSGSKLLSVKEAPGAEAAQFAGQDAPEARTGGKTIREWKELQEAFKDLPRLPEGWIRVRARAGDAIYFYNTRTNESSFEFPLPEGWAKMTSKSTGKTYYFNQQKQISQFEVPQE